MFFELVSLIFVLSLVYLYLTKAPPNYPPGPTPLPFIGNTHQLPDGHFFPIAKEWSEKYGPVIGLWMGRMPMIIIHGVDCIIEALRKEEFQSRPSNFSILARSFGKPLGIFFGVGEQWSSSRKFAIKNMKAYGKHEKENVISDEISRLMERFEDNTTIKGTGIFSISAVNVIWTMIANKRIDLEDEESKRFLDHLNALFRSGNPVGKELVNISPLFRFVSKSFKFQMSVAAEIQDYMRKVIQEHRELLDPNNPLDLIDHYLVEMKQNKKNELFTDEDLITIGFDLFGAGAESTSNSIEYILLYMILHPQVQQKMQDEIDRVLGRSRKPKLDDKNQMHYTMAVITEVERLNSVAPANVPHNCAKDTTFNGYFIPKGTMIAMNLRSLGYDPKYWKNPDEFDPDRFLNDKGEFSKPAFLATFGMGQRQCVGEVFVRNTIFLFTTTFFEKFSIRLPVGESTPSTFPLPGFTTAPQPFNIHLTSRY